MTGGVTLRFPAMTLNQAIVGATARWRTLAEDPEAILPWSTNIEFVEETEPRMEQGRIVDGDPRMMAVVRIEFDNKMVDEVTGASTATTGA